MLVIRYFVEHLRQHQNPHHFSQRSVVHQHCKEHHWMRVNEVTIVGIGHFRNQEALSSAKNHKNVIMLPHLHDKTPVKNHFEKKALRHPDIHAGRFDHFKKFGVEDTDTASDFIGRLIDAGHYQFEPNI